MSACAPRSIGDEGGVYNEFLCFDETNTDEDQETWGFDHAMFGESKTIEMASGFDYPGFD